VRHHLIYASCVLCPHPPLPAPSPELGTLHCPHLRRIGEALRRDIDAGQLPGAEVGIMRAGRLRTWRRSDTAWQWAEDCYASTRPSWKNLSKTLALSALRPRQHIVTRVDEMERGEMSGKILPHLILRIFHRSYACFGISRRAHAGVKISPQYSPSPSYHSDGFPWRDATPATVRGRPTAGAGCPPPCDAKGNAETLMK
jgi:hypothetical protein